MSQEANPKIIGGFVLGALLLLVAAILFFGGGRYFERTLHMVTYFPGTVQGLSVGARVEFQGVQVGEVTDMQLNFWRKDKEFAIPVYYDIWPERIHLFGDTSQREELSTTERKALYKELVEKGLRARLESVSLVTGQYMISLGLYPDSKYTLVEPTSDRLEVPAVAAMRDRVDDMVAGLRLDRLVNSAIEALDAVKALAKNKALLGAVNNLDHASIMLTELLSAATSSIEPVRLRLDSTLQDYSQLAVTFREEVLHISKKIRLLGDRIDELVMNVDAQVSPISQSAQNTLSSVNSMIGSGSDTRYNLNQFLEEAGGAARSLRLLADYLEQNPQALIMGRYR